MAQEFSVAYRAPNIADILATKVDGRTGYRFFASPQFDGSPAFVQLFEMSSGVGFLDPAVDRRKLHSMPGHQHIRATFDPTSFDGSGTLPNAGITDAQQFWMQFQPVDGGVAGAVSNPVLVLTYSQHKGLERINIAGDAPNAANIAGSLTLSLPRRMRDFSIMNYHGSNSLFVAFDPLGPEYEIKFGGTFRVSEGSETSLTVRGGGSAVAFAANFTVATTTT